MSRARGVLPLLAGLCVPSWALQASAQVDAARSASNDGGESHARELFRDGNSLVEQARYVEALEKFRAAYSAWQNPKIKLNIATTLVALGRNAEAFEAYRQYLGEADPSPDRRREVEAMMRDLEPRMARVSLQLGADVRRVTLDGRELRPDELSRLPLDPGRHVLLAESAAGEKATSFDIAAGQHQQISVRSPEPASRLDVAAVVEADTSPPAPGLGWAIQTRVDIDGTGHGAVAAGGLALALNQHWEVAAGALVGAHAGAWAGIQLALFGGPLQPTLGASVPVFFVGSARPGISGEVGVRWAASRDFLFLSLRAALVHFPALPAGYVETVLVPSLGVEMRL